MKKINFEIDNAQLIDEKPESSFSVLSFDFFASGKNRHNYYVDEETLMRTADTIKNVPLVWEYDPILDDAYTHTDTEVPCGFIPENAEIKSRVLSDGRTMLSVDGYVWKRYTGKILDFFVRDGEKPVSVEVTIFDIDEDRPDGLVGMLDYRFEAITILGNRITPAIPLANAKIIKFEYQEALKEFNSKDNNIEKKFQQIRKGRLLTFPYKNREDINPALKGIDPPISVAQANEIARQADAIGISEDKNGWAIAIGNFKKTHEVKDGKWVKKEKMSYGTQFEEDPVSLKEVIIVTDEKEKEITLEMEAPDKDTENPKEEEKESPEEEKEEHKEEDMSLDPYLDVAAVLSFLEKEVDDYAEVAAEFAKPYAEMNYAKVMASMYAYMCKTAEMCNKMSAEKEEMAAEFAKAKDELAAYMAENEELKKFKDDKEKEQFDFAVDSVLKEIEEKTEIPTEKILELKEKSKEFSLDTFENWRLLAKATGLDFAAKEVAEDGGVVRYALPFVLEDRKNDSRSPWSR